MNRSFLTHSFQFFIFMALQVLLLRNLVRGRDWVRIDFNIGKLVEPAGD